MKKKILILLVIFALILTSVGCKKTTANSRTTTISTVTNTPSKKKMRTAQAGFVFNNTNDFKNDTYNLNNDIIDGIFKININLKEEMNLLVMIDYHPVNFKINGTETSLYKFIIDNKEQDIPLSINTQGLSNGTHLLSFAYYATRETTNYNSLVISYKVIKGASESAININENKLTQFQILNKQYGFMNISKENLENKKFTNRVKQIVVKKGEETYIPLVCGGCSSQNSYGFQFLLDGRICNIDDSEYKTTVIAKGKSLYKMIKIKAPNQAGNYYGFFVCYVNPLNTNKFYPQAFLTDKINIIVE